MAMNMRRGAGFAAGLLLGVAGAAALFEFGFRGGQPSHAPDAPVAQQAAPAKPDTRVAGAAPAASAAALPVSSVDCAATAFSPIVSPSGSDDGKVSLQQGLSAPVVLSMITSGKELAASGRARDAETTFLMACRGAQAVKPADPLLVADAQYQLGRHYATLAQQPDERRRGELLDRAARLYGASLQVYRARHGEDNERTRYAAAGLAAVRQQLAGSGRPLPAPAREAVAQAPAKPAEVKPEKPAEAKAAEVKHADEKPAEVKRAEVKPAEVKQAEAKPEKPEKSAGAQQAEVKQAEARPPVPAPAPPAAVARVQPSFDCAKAHSPAERTICADPELARADRELGRLHARAKAASPDPRAFQRRSDAIWAEREAHCTTRDCLRQWYAQRRADLLTAQAGAGPVARQQPPRVRRPVRPPPPQAKDDAPAEASGNPYAPSAD